MALEHVYAAAGQSFAPDKIILGNYRAEESIYDWDEGRPFLLKLHGDVDIRSGRVLTREQYERAYGEGSALPELLHTLFGSRRPLLFLGCSLLSDRTLTELERAGLRQTNAYHFAMLETPSDDMARQIRQNELIQRYGIQTIWFAQGDFGALQRVLPCLAH